MNRIIIPITVTSICESITFFLYYPINVSIFQKIDGVLVWS